MSSRPVDLVRWICTVVFTATALAAPLCAQQQRPATVADAQVESNVLQALANNAKLADQTISTAAVQGTVTLSGTVRDEETRTLAEQVVARTAGVSKVVDELTLGADGARETASTNAQAGSSNDGSNPNLQSDGTLATPDAQQTQPNELPQQGSVGAPQDTRVNPQNTGVLPSAQQPPYEAGDPSQSRQGGYGANNGAANGGPSASYPAPGNYPHPSNAPVESDPHPATPPDRPSYRRGGDANGRGPQRRYTSPQAQAGGQPVVVPAGAVLRVRTDQEMDSRRTQAGTSFSGVVLDDVIAGGYVAIPRGAQVQGVVSEAKASGALQGRGELDLQLTGVVLASNVYPIASDTWVHAGRDKTLRTVDSALGLGAVGAIIGGVAGGGAGAAIGAGVGGAAGIGASATSQGEHVYIPAEAILSFRLIQPTQLTTLAQGELNRLGAGLPYPRRRYAQPTPPYAYGPYPYAYPRYYYGRRYPY